MPIYSSANSGPPTADPARPPSAFSPQRLPIFLLLTTLIIAAAITRSAIATRLDSFTLDEPYHIVAGVSHIQRHDYRINPEHPPLVKLWVGAWVSHFGYQLSPFREIHDKTDERKFTNEDFWTERNNPPAIQHRTRAAMFAFSAILLFLFTLILRATFGPLVALGTLLILAIDPFVSANLPVVMTDLPVAILGTGAVILAARAFLTWRWPHLAACATVLGLALASKHSAPLFAIVVAILGIFLALTKSPQNPRDTRIIRLSKVAAVLAASVIVLWSFYQFRFTESATPQETFNRPLADKISDLHSPAYRLALTHLAAWHLLPRSYLWGLADTARAGLEGRFESRLVWGKPYLNPPWFFFPTIFFAKLPIGLLVLIALGLYLFAARQVPDHYRLALFAALFAAAVILVVLMRSSAYGGMRHALPVTVLLSIFGGVALQAALCRPQRWLKILAAAALLGAAISALPVMRPWEYFNEFVGGADHAYLYFDDEGVDLYQRMNEEQRYYQQHIQPTGEIPFTEYFAFIPEMKYRRIEWVGSDEVRDEAAFHNPKFTGTILIPAKSLGPNLIRDLPDLRAATPFARYGQLMVFRGTYDIGPLLAEGRYYRGIGRLFAENPDNAAAERFLAEAVALDPNGFCSRIELGNVQLAQGKRAEALETYRVAASIAPKGSEFQQEVEKRIRALSTNPTTAKSLRDPCLE